MWSFSVFLCCHSVQHLKQPFSCQLFETLQRPYDVAVMIPKTDVSFASSAVQWYMAIFTATHSVKSSITDFLFRQYVLVNKDILAICCLSCCLVPLYNSHIWKSFHWHCTKIWCEFPTYEEKPVLLSDECILRKKKISFAPETKKRNLSFHRKPKMDEKLLSN